MTFEELTKVKDLLDKHDSDFYKLVGSTLGIPIIVDPKMPANSWKIVCGQGFYEKVCKHCGSISLGLNERKLKI